MNLFEMKVNAFHVQKKHFITNTYLQKEWFRADKKANTYIFSLLSKLSKKSIAIECHGVVQREKHGDFRIRTFVIRKNFEVLEQLRPQEALKFWRFLAILWQKPLIQTFRLGKIPAKKEYFFKIVDSI
jgi:hypothetical protein